MLPVVHPRACNQQAQSRRLMPRLTQQELQEIIRYLEADKPLPDKYRFLLFADKREVELVWNGKTSDASNIVLPFQVIKEVDEPRAEKDTPARSPACSTWTPAAASLRGGPTSSSGATTSPSSPPSRMARCARRSKSMAASS